MPGSGPESVNLPATPEIVPESDIRPRTSFEVEAENYFDAVDALHEASIRVNVALTRVLKTVKSSEPGEIDNDLLDKFRRINNGTSYPHST